MIAQSMSFSNLSFFCLQLHLFAHKFTKFISVCICIYTFINSLNTNTHLNIHKRIETHGRRRLYREVYELVNLHTDLFGPADMGQIDFICSIHVLNRIFHVGDK